MRTLMIALAGSAALMGFAGAASADSNGAAMNSCKPHDWIRFTDAVEAWDYETLAELANEPELRACEFQETAAVLVCEINPLACIEPAAPPPPPTPPVDIDRRGADPLPPPGAAIGVERDHNEPSGGGGGGGGSEPSDGKR